MKAVELINKAWVLSGIVGRDLEQVNGSQGRDGLFWLNALLSTKSSTGKLLPYYGHLEMNAVVGQEDYFVEGLVTLECVTFNIGDVRYSLRGEQRRTYFGSSRADNINSLPYKVYFERVPGGCQVYFYFKPDDTYELKFTGLVSLTSVTNDTELNTALDGFYQIFLIHELAEALCNWYKMSLPPATAQKLTELRDQMVDINAMDLTVGYRTTLRSRSAINYGIVNLGNGWTT